MMSEKETPIDLGNEKPRTSRTFTLGVSFALLVAAFFGGGLTYIIQKFQSQTPDISEDMHIQNGQVARWKVVTTGNARAFAEFKENGKLVRFPDPCTFANQELSCPIHVEDVGQHKNGFLYVIRVTEGPEVDVTPENGTVGTYTFKSGPGGCTACKLYVTK